MPFVDPDAEGFVAGTPRDRGDLMLALMEGEALIERACFELVERLGATVGPVVYATGGAVRSERWLQIRASVLGRTLAVPREASSAMGAALLAAAAALFGSLEEATDALVHIDRRVEPDAKAGAFYDGRYRQFVEAMREKGYCLS